MYESNEKMSVNMHELQSNSTLNIEQKNMLENEVKKLTKQL